MTEEEKEAIENIKERINYIEKHMKNYEKINCKTAFCEVLQTEKASLEIILNLIEKKDKIIDEAIKLLADLELSKDREGYEIIEANDWKQYFEKKVSENNE